MSWMKRAQAGEGAGAAPQPYAAPQPQPYTNQQNMYPNYPGGTQQQPQQYWAGGGAQYNQQYTQYQQEYPANANHYQQPQYNHTYNNPGYNNTQQNYQQTYYQNQQQMAYPPNQPTNSDGWEDNWDWGWEESAKQAQAQKAQNTAPPPQPEQVYNNANVLEESFETNSTNTWNWAAEDKKDEPAVLPPHQASEGPATLPPEPVENDMSPEPSNVQNVTNGAPAPVEEVRSLGDREVKERMPNLALGKRFHLDNLTPQWSIESQMSQESSDGPLTHSESTYRSENQSRNSNSPGPNTDNSNFNYSHTQDLTQNSEMSKRSDSPTLADGESQEDLARGLQDMTLVNRENLTAENFEVERRGSQHGLPPPQASQPAPPAGAMPPPPPVVSPRPPSTGVASPSPGPAPMPAPVAGPTMPASALAPMMPAPVMPAPAPAPMMSTPAPAPMMPTPAPAPMMPAPAPAPMMPPPSSAPMMPPPTAAPMMPPSTAAPMMPPPSSLPPPNFPPPTNSQNPFKHSGPYGHKSKPSSGPGQYTSTGLSSPAMVGKASREPVGFEANLETTPDNSERPDAPGGGASPAPPAPPENLEVAPRTERNEYLQTAHLSASDYENTQLLPCGVRRVPVGRREEEPPAGLARLAPGDGACERAPEPYREPPDAYRRADGEYRAGWEARVVPGLREPPEPVPEPAPPDSPSERREERYSRSERDRDRDRDRDREREDRKPDRRERRDRERNRERRERDESPEERRKRRSARAHRYETEDTDYYSDKERERRRHREGSYASRPPRAEREPSRRYEEGARSRPAERPERAYRDIDPHNKYASRRRDRNDYRRRVTFSREARSAVRDDSKSEGETYSSPSRADSRENTATDEEPERRRERRHRHSTRRTADPYYDGVGAGAYADPYLAQRQQYEYYERLRAADPAAYMQLYKRLMAAAHPPHLTHDGYMTAASYGAREERGSVHSGRSSAQGLKGNDTYYMFRNESLRDAPSLRADLSDRDLNTEVSLPTNLETSTVRSERMTPHRFSTAHVKGSISSRHVVVVRESWPVDGRPATVQLLSLRHATHRDPRAAELHDCPGPLVKGVTHKKSVIEYCGVRVRSSAREGAPDPLGYALLWDLLALLLTQNGVVVGSDIAELLMKNTREHEYKPAPSKPAHDGSRRASSVSGSAEEVRSSPDFTEPSGASNESSPIDEKAALDKLRELLLYGNRQEALEWAMSSGLWGHALQLAAHSERRTRSAVAARFLAAVPRRDPLHTLYAALAQQPTSIEEAGDWRPHAAIILANSGARPEHDTRALTAFGDRLAARGLIYCAQFCYVAGGVSFSRHPLAPLSPPPAPDRPPRLSLLLANPHARTMAALATTRAIQATEIYEYALSLHQHYCIPELQVYKFVMACRLTDCGEYERALAYVEQAARCVTRAPRDYSPLLLANLANMADRLKYHDPALHEDPPLLEEGAEGEGSPRHQQWLADVQSVAQMMQAEAASHQQQQAATEEYSSQQHLQYSWDQAHQYQQQQQQQLQPPQAPQYPLPTPADPPDAPEYPPQSAYYPPPAPPAEDAPAQPYDDWHRTEEQHVQTFGDSSYWQGDNTYGYGEPSALGGAEEPPRPTITMPGTRTTPAHTFGEMDGDSQQQQQNERDTDTPKSSKKADAKPKDGGIGAGGAKSEGGKGGWLGGILTKLSLRPPNQMILPDDKNPTIVWDAEQKRWKNLDGEDAGSDQPPPPPRMADLTQHIMAQNTSTPNQSPGAAPGAPGAPPSAAPVSNIFKMQKGRHIKKSYVDVFNPNGNARALPPAGAVLGPPPSLAPNPTYFVPPAPAHAQGGYEMAPDDYSGM